MDSNKAPKPGLRNLIMSFLKLCFSPDTCVACSIYIYCSLVYGIDYYRNHGQCNWKRNGIIPKEIPGECLIFLFDL